MPPTHTFQAPTGTRDFYPIEMARRRFIEDKWRKVSTRHGFEEIDGPTFEHLDLYTVKSGDAIVSELFSFTRAGGEKTYALRPEFTPTLARMYAARAGSLPKPAKWFWQSTCFRAERPQRGRLREFLQWNCDVIGGEDATLSDADLLECSISLLESCGLTPQIARVRINDRRALESWASRMGVPAETLPAMYTLLDKRSKLADEVFLQEAAKLGLPQDVVTALAAKGGLRTAFDPDRLTELSTSTLGIGSGLAVLQPLAEQVKARGMSDWCEIDTSIARGLAYYTGMVFEVHEAGGKERAIAGGGRYDNLIELFGGPPTPAVGFGMGDVVLSLVLQDKGLMPSDKEIAKALGLRPDVFIIANETPEAQAALTPLLAALRRKGMHARRSYKATKNIGKLLKEAADSGARYAVILESGTEATLKNLDTGEQPEGRIAHTAIADHIKPS